MTISQQGIIAAVSPTGIIGAAGKIPWHYPGDLKRFKQRTHHHTVIMGRKTFESLGLKPLKERRNIVITRNPIPGVECFSSLQSALLSCAGEVWYIGGANIYREAMQFADLIDLTYVPDQVEGDTRFPTIDLNLWDPGPLEQHPEDARLKVRIYHRRKEKNAT